MRRGRSPRGVGYIVARAGDGATAPANREAFDRSPIVPRMGRGAVDGDLSCTVLGTAMPEPVGIAPEAPWATMTASSSGGNITQSVGLIR